MRRLRYLVRIVFGIIIIITGLYLSVRTPEQSDPLLNKTLTIALILFLLFDGIYNYLEGRKKEK